MKNKKIKSPIFKIGKINIISASYKKQRRFGGMFGYDYFGKGIIIINNKKYLFDSNINDGIQFYNLPLHTNAQYSKMYDKVEKAFELYVKKKAI